MKPISPHYPITATAHILGARWTLQIIDHLREPRRFCELQSLIEGINPRTLSQRLKFLELAGLLVHESAEMNPSYAVYRLTEEGVDLLPIIDHMISWAEKWHLSIPYDDTQVV